MDEPIDSEPKADTPQPAPPAQPETSATAEQSASYLHPDTAAASASQRLRLIPPDGKPLPWWVRHREKLILAEMILTGVFFLLTLYFLWLWIFSPSPIAYSPDRLGFIHALAALPPIAMDASWRVKGDPGRWRNIVVHHTATASGTAESIDRFHREVRKWENGLGYHFLIGNGNGMRNGEVVPSRRWLEQLDGAHIKEMRGQKKANSIAIGIALVGNFQDSIATPEQLASLRGLLRFLIDEYGIETANIAGHGEVSVNHTDCPGRLFFLDEVVNVL